MNLILLSFSLIILSSCSVKPGVIEFETVTDRGLYELQPYEEKVAQDIDENSDN